MNSAITPEELTIRSADGSFEMDFCWIVKPEEVEGKEPREWPSFRMGSRGYDANQEPIHEVRFEHPFLVGKFPVTQEQFRAFDGGHKNEFEGNPRHPAESMDWNQARRFAEWFNEHMTDQIASALTSRGISANYEVRLSWETEWEYACRGGTETKYYTGDGEEALLKAGWFGVNSQKQTHPVGELAPNQFGLYDMHGNVWEWCEDVWDEHAYRSNRLTANDNTNDDPYRVIRGGSWFDSAGWCRSACRGRGWPSGRFGVQGFRLVLAPVPEKPVRGAQETSKAEPGRGAVSDGTERKAEGPGGAGMDELLGKGKLPERPA